MITLDIFVISPLLSITVNITISTCGIITSVIDSSGEMTNITNVIMPHVEMVIFTVIDSSGENV
jgi:hypothetical protein